MAERTTSKIAGHVSVPTKNVIERKALILFSEKGYDATSMREIAEAAGITKPVIYYYFKNKEQLCHHLISSGLEEFRADLIRICMESDVNVFDQIVRMVNIHFEFCRRRKEFMRFIYAINFGPDRDKINYDFHAYGMEIFHMQTALMCKAVEAGLIQEGKEEDAVYYLRGIINTFVMLFMDGRHPLNSNLARTAVTDLVYGLGRRNSERH